jgi:hypothetical protein
MWTERPVSSGAFSVRSSGEGLFHIQAQRNFGLRGISPRLDRQHPTSRYIRSSCCCCGRLRSGRPGRTPRRWAACLDAGSPLRGPIDTLLRGSEQPIDSLEPTVRDPTGDPYLRLGAAARLLLEMPPADLALQMQAFLISGIANNEALACQLLWNVHVAHRFAEDWVELANNAFQFRAPRSSLPQLMGAVGDVRRGSGTLRKLLQTAHDAVGRALPSFFARLF